MTPVAHKKPAVDQPLTRVSFELDDPDLGESEVLWARWLGPDTVQLDNIPLFAFGVSMGDRVRVVRSGDINRFAGVIEAGGHSTYRLMLTDASDRGTTSRFRDIVVLGCGYEQLSPRLLAIDVPPDVDVFRVYELLEHGLRACAWTFEEGHCGHPVDSGSHS